MSQKKYSLKKLSEDTLRKANTPLTALEIWNKSKEYGFQDKIDSVGKTPWSTIGAQLYVDIRDNPNSKFVQFQKRPAKFTLKDMVINKKLNCIKSWDEWEIFKTSFFNCEKWIEKDNDILINEEKIEPIYLNGLKWEHVFTPYDLSPEYEYIYEYCMDYVFKKLEYQQYILNTRTQGKWCAYCKRYTEFPKVKVCPFCGRNLFNYPIND